MHHSTGIWIFSLCVEWAAPERWLFCKKEQSIRHSTHHKQGGAAANSMENRSVPPVWVCLRLLQSKQKAPSIRVGTFRFMHGVWSLCARRRNPASPLIEMRFAHGCRQQVLFVWRMQNPSFFARKGVFAGETFAGSLRFSIKVAAGGRFAAQIESAPKRNTTRVGGVSFWSGLRGSNSLPGIPRIAFRNSQEPYLTSD